MKHATKSRSVYVLVIIIIHTPEFMFTLKATPNWIPVYRQPLAHLQSELIFQLSRYGPFYYYLYSTTSTFARPEVSRMVKLLLRSYHSITCLSVYMQKFNNNGIMEFPSRPHPLVKVDRMGNRNSIWSGLRHLLRLYWGFDLAEQVTDTIKVQCTRHSLRLLRVWHQDYINKEAIVVF